MTNIYSVKFMYSFSGLKQNSIFPSIPFTTLREQISVCLISAGDSRDNMRATDPAAILGNDDLQPEYQPISW